MQGRSIPCIYGTSRPDSVSHPAGDTCAKADPHSRQAVRLDLPELRQRVADYCAKAAAVPQLRDTQLLYNGHESNVCAAPPRTYPIVGTDPPESAAALVYSSSSSTTASPDHTNTLLAEIDDDPGAGLRALPTWLTNSAMYKDKDIDSIFDSFDFDALGPPPSL